MRETKDNSDITLFLFKFLVFVPKGFDVLTTSSMCFFDQIKLRKIDCEIGELISIVV